MSGRSKTTIVNVHVFNDTGFSDLTSLTIEDGLIIEDTSGATTIDGHGGYLLPGLIDCHIHLDKQLQLEQLREGGVTTGLDMATNPITTVDPFRNQPGFPNILTAGVPILGSRFAWKFMGKPPNSLLETPDLTEDFVTRRVNEGSDYIKIITDASAPTMDDIKAINNTAYKYNKLTIAHAPDHDGFTRSFDSNCDVVTHAPLDRPLTQEEAERMANSKSVSVATLTMMVGMSKMQKPPPEMLKHFTFTEKIIGLFKVMTSPPKKYEHARDSVIAMIRAGVPILAGTDANSGEFVPNAVPHGSSLHEELRLLVEAGLSNVDALRAATTLAAKHFRLNDRGSIKPGLRADLVLLKENPLARIENTTSIVKVWCAGYEFTPTSQ